MEKLLTYTCLLLVGVALGWWWRDTVPAVVPLQSQAPIAVPTQSRLLPAQAELAVARETSSINAQSTAADVSSTPDAAQFAQLLSEQQFERAVAYYDNAVAVDDRYQQLLRAKLADYLGARHAACANGAFVELVDVWLDAYYQDISVLLLLAENQRLCSSPEEAARTLQIAKTYAIESGSQERVAAAVARLIAATDETLSQQKNWVALLGFLEFLQAVDLSTDGSELRRAGLYRLLGEPQRSQAVLLALREKDDGTDAKWTAALNRQWEKSTPAASRAEPPAQAIRLVRRGDHFLIPALIGGVREVLLLIDTGASVTVLTKQSFAQLNSSAFGYQGARLFNTANGMTQGEVYQATSITLGDTRLDGPEIAVLDYQSADGIDGLLGMNVLRNYRFHIDQEKAVLYLHAR